MRILRIELRATLRANSPNVRFDSESVRRQFYDEFEGIIAEITENARKRIASNFPPDYTVFVRMVAEPQTNTVRTLIWVDDPTIRWPAGLLARRAWKLSVPVLAHALSETFEQRIQGISMQIDRSKARVSSFAPMRFWSDPLILTVGAFVLASVVWLYLFPATVTRLIGVAGP